MSEWDEEEGFCEEDTEEYDLCDYGFEFCEDPQTKEAGLCTTDCQQYLCGVESDADGGTSTWKCQVCGCTDSTPCIGGCSWVRKNLCSACAQKQKEEEEKAVQENDKRPLTLPEREYLRQQKGVS